MVGEKIARDLGVDSGGETGLGLGGDLPGAHKDKGVVVETEDELAVEKRVKKRKVLKRKVSDNSKNVDMGQDGGAGSVGDAFVGTVRKSNTTGPSGSTGPTVGVLARKKKRMMLRKKKMTVEYDISSGDDEIEDPRSGQKRKGCGYLFSNAPKALMTQFLTRDDKLKLGRCALPRKIKKMERNVARVSTIGFDCPTSCIVHSFNCFDYVFYTV